MSLFLSLIYNVFLLIFEERIVFSVRKVYIYEQFRAAPHPSLRLPGSNGPGSNEALVGIIGFLFPFAPWAFMLYFLDCGFSL